MRASRVEDADISAVQEISRAPGRMREARSDERELVIHWIEAFAEEALGAAGGRCDKWAFEPVQE